MRSMLILIACAASLAACGSSTSDRTLSGAGVGAAAGAATAVVAGGSVGTAAAVGAVAGGVIGAATDEKDIDLGKPAWE